MKILFTLPASMEEKRDKKKRKAMSSSSQADVGDDSDDSSSSSQEPRRANQSRESQGAGSSTVDRLTELRKEKRLEMNRVSARKRRARKKERVEELEHQVDQLTTRVQQVQMLNDSLTLQLQNLNRELEVARSTISILARESQQRDVNSIIANALSGRGQPDATAGASMRDLLREQETLLRGILPTSALGATGSLPATGALMHHGAALGVTGISGAPGLTGLELLSGRPATNRELSLFLNETARGLHPPSIQNTLASPMDLGRSISRVNEGVQASRLVDALSPHHRSVESGRIQTFADTILKQEPKHQTGHKF